MMKFSNVGNNIIDKNNMAAFDNHEWTEHISTENIVFYKQHMTGEIQDAAHVPCGFTPSLEVPNNEHLCDPAWVEHVAYTGEHYWLHGENGERSDTRPYRFGATHLKERVWVLRKDDSGRHVWHNHKTNERRRVHDEPTDGDDEIGQVELMLSRLIVDPAPDTSAADAAAAAEAEAAADAARAAADAAAAAAEDVAPAAAGGDAAEEGDESDPDYYKRPSLTGFFLNAPNKTLEKQAKDYEEKHGAGSYGEKYAAMVKKWWDKAVWARSHAGGPKRAHM
jgi:hypothetical protein